MVTTRAKRKSNTTPSTAPPIAPSSPPAKRTRASASKPTSRDVATTGSCKLTTLPYHLLFEILQHVAEDEPRPLPSNLLAIATLCRALHPPAIAALYRKPRINSSVHAFRLLETLQQHDVYTQKVKSLELQVDPLLTRKTPDYGYFEANKMILAAKGLRELQLVSPTESPYARREDGPKWDYTMDIFEALDGKLEGEAVQDGHRLRSWRWNGEFMTKLGISELLSIHMRPSLQSLTHLSFVHLDTLTGSPEPAIDISSILACLPKLRSLEFVASELANDTLFEALDTCAPKLRLRSLTLDRLRQMSSGLTTLLKSPLLSDLERLSVLHNPNIDLGFLAQLGHTPKLRTLTFNGQYYHGKTIWEGNEPLFDMLLPAHPVWPSTLEHISLLSLRNGTGDQAEELIGSLIDRAYRNQLPFIRSVHIHFILPRLSWRERAEFRDNWVEKFNEAFVRRQGSPRRTNHQTRSSSLESEFGGGKCDAKNVELKIDNIRPADVQFGEEDFIEFEVLTTARASGPPRRPRRATAVQPTSGRGAPRTARKTARRRVRAIATWEDEEDDDDYRE